MSDGLVHRVFLIRHGETVDNVAGLYAGVRDSALTSHGALQAEKLGRFLAQQDIVFSHIYSSDLSRAVKTAEAIRAAQPDPLIPVLQLLELREQDFGTGEGQPFAARHAKTTSSSKGAASRSQFRDMETKASMTGRANRFLDSTLMPLLHGTSDENRQVVAVVSHGMLLSSLWKAILARQQPNSVDVAKNLLEMQGAVSLEHLGGWSNTGYLELEFRPSSVPADDQDNGPAFKLAIKRINGKEHLKDLKRTRGGVGSSKHDESQTSLHTFFSKRRKGLASAQSAASGMSSQTGEAQMPSRDDKSKIG